MTRLHRRSNNSPSAVTATRLPVRSSSRHASCSSSVRREWLTADWVTKIRRAASVKLPSSTTATNARNCLKSGTQSIIMNHFHRKSPYGRAELMPNYHLWHSTRLPKTHGVLRNAAEKISNPPWVCSAKRLRADRSRQGVGDFRPLWLERHPLARVELGQRSRQDVLW